MKNYKNLTKCALSTPHLTKFSYSLHYFIVIVENFTPSQRFLSRSLHTASTLFCFSFLSYLSLMNLNSSFTSTLPRSCQFPFIVNFSFSLHDEIEFNEMKIKKLVAGGKIAYGKKRK